MEEYFMDQARFIETDAPVVVLQAGKTRLEEAEKLLIIATLKRARFNRTRAAGMLGIGIRTLQRKIKQYAQEADLVRSGHQEQKLQMAVSL